MVKQVSFKGMQLKTRAQRRVLVVGYYAVLLAVGISLLVRPGQRDIVALINFAFFSCLLLGGIYGRGPVKSYTKPILPLEAGGGLSFWDRKGDEVQALGLGRQAVRRDDEGGGEWEPLDEREQRERDHAHYEAYRMVRWTLGISIVAYWLTQHWTSSWIAGRLPVLAMILLVYVLSLPQAVVLWIEPADVDAV